MEAGFSQMPPNWQRYEQRSAVQDSIEQSPSIPLRFLIGH